MLTQNYKLKSFKIPINGTHLDKQLPMVWSCTVFFFAQHSTVLLQHSWLIQDAALYTSREPQAPEEHTVQPRNGSAVEDCHIQMKENCRNPKLYLLPPPPAKMTLNEAQRNFLKVYYNINLP